MKIKDISRVKTPAFGKRRAEMNKTFRTSSKKILVRFPNGGSSSGTKTFYVTPTLKDSITFYKNAI